MKKMYEENQYTVNKYIIWILLAIIFIVVIFYAAYIWLSWTILESMYMNKAGLDWFNIIFYHRYTFIVAALLALIVINPIPGHSDVYELFRTYKEAIREAIRGEEELTITPPSLPPTSKKILWIFWQLTKWVIAFAIIFSSNGIPSLGNITEIIYMMTKGLGSWGSIPRIFMLAAYPANANELVSLIPSMEIQYRIFYDILEAIIIIISLRILLKMIKHFISEHRNLWIRDFFILLTFIALSIVLGSPYWAMDVTTPYVYIITLLMLVSFIAASFIFHLGGIDVNLTFSRRRRLVIVSAGILLISLLVINIGVVTYYRFNWNNRWIEYEWKPLTDKQIKVTRWVSGIQDIHPQPMSNVPGGNLTKTLSVVRQWDRTAAYTKMKNQLGVNWMSLCKSDIIHINNREYWAAPTTIKYPSTDWISTHLIYTHAAKILLIDSHTGDLVPVTKAFGVKSEPSIYYGENFGTNVYVNVRGYDEIGNTSYLGQPDYILSGWQRALWFLLQGQLGFAFSPPQEKINMLYVRDVLQRVRNILIYGLTVDPDAYIVSDGKNIYYAVQVFVSFPIHSRFSASNYLRFFAVVLVNVEHGDMHGYIVGKQDNFLVNFYKMYYPEWNEKIPDWLIPQLRYPEALLGTYNSPGQLDVDFLYHVSDPFIWRSGSQFYERPPATKVHYILMAIKNQLYFIGFQAVEFLGSEGKNLAGIYTAFGGPQLGRIDLYAVPNATKPFIGPSAALQALETDDYVRKQLTLLTNPRTGNILLYSIGGKLYYFIPVYITIKSPTAVITKMAFVGIIDAATGTKVATGKDSIEAYYNLKGTTITSYTEASHRIGKIKNLFSNYTLINPTKINANIEIKINNLTYVNENQWNDTLTGINTFIKSYVQKYSSKEVYYWYGNNNTINFGILVSENGIVKLYYITILYKT